MVVYMVLELNKSMFVDIMQGEGYSNVALEVIFDFEEQLEQEQEQEQETKFDKQNIKAYYTEYELEDLLREYDHLIDLYYEDEELEELDQDELQELKLEELKKHKHIIKLKNGEYLLIGE
jgi:hypothetical protein